MSTIGDNVLNMAKLVKDVSFLTKLDPMLVYRILELNVAYMSREAVEVVDDDLAETDFPTPILLEGEEPQNDN